MLQYTLPKAPAIDTITLPQSIQHSSWDLSWLDCVPQLQRVDLNGSSFRTLQSRGMRISALCPLHTVRLKLTDDAPTQHKGHLTSLKDVTVAFGHGERMPTADTLAELLCTCTGITRLNFTFAQSFFASQPLMDAIAGLQGLIGLQINSFDIMHLAAHDLVIMSNLTCIQNLELSGMNLVGERCALWPAAENMSHSTSLRCG